MVLGARKWTSREVPSRQCTTSREVICNGICLLMEEFRQFLRILPEMLGFDSDRSSRLHASTKNLWEITRYIVWEFHHSTRIERCKKSLGGLALHSISKNMPRVPKCQFYPSLKMPRVANQARQGLDIGELSIKYDYARCHKKGTVCLCCMLRACYM